MLTDTQREWAEAQLGEKRSAALSGEVVDAKPGKRNGYVLTVEGEDGSATIAMDVSSETAAASKGETSTVLIEGVVSDVVYDDEQGRVGLVLDGDNGRVIDWQVPAMSPEEVAELQPAPPTEAEIVEQLDQARAERLTSLRALFGELLLDPEFVLVLRAALAEEKEPPA